jgi:dihydrofolate reductase
MRRVISTTFVTLDGVMQAPGGPTEDESGGFRHGGWSVRYWDDVMSEFMGGVMGDPFDLLIGRRTYDIFAGYWPTSTEPGAKELNAATKYVATRSDRPLDWSPAVRLSDAAADVAALKREDGSELQVHGSGNLLQTLLREGLLDRITVWTFPVTVGDGKRLFGDGTMPSGLHLIETKIASTGVVISTYEPAGELVTGSFAQD